MNTLTREERIEYFGKEMTEKEMEDIVARAIDAIDSVDMNEMGDE